MISGRISKLKFKSPNANVGCDVQFRCKGNLSAGLDPSGLRKEWSGTAEANPHFTPVPSMSRKFIGYGIRAGMELPAPEVFFC